jgi:hypothetical protein
VLLAEVEEVDAVVVSDVVDVASVVVAVRAETMPVLKVPITMRLIMRTLAAEDAIAVVFMFLNLTNKKDLSGELIYLHVNS